MFRAVIHGFSKDLAGVQAPCRAREWNIQNIPVVRCDVLPMTHWSWTFLEMFIDYVLPARILNVQVIVHCHVPLPEGSMSSQNPRCFFFVR